MDKDSKTIVRPCFTVTLGIWHFVIKNDPDEIVANQVESKLNGEVRTCIKPKDDVDSALWTSAHISIFNKVINLVEKAKHEWFIEYYELGDDITRYPVVDPISYNHHEFHTKEEFEDFLKKYYTQASNQRMHDWWAWREGKNPLPLNHDGSLLKRDEGYCEDCQNCKAIDCKHEIKDGIETYTPIYGCKYKGKKCKFHSYPPEHK